MFLVPRSQTNAPDPLDAVEEMMQRLILAGPPKDALRNALGAFVSRRGKRIRARIALFAADALMAQPESGIAWGAVCELLHNASLIHDDIQDGDRTRRGHPSFWAEHGIAQAINAGDLSIALGYAAVAHVPVSDAQKWRLTEVISEAACAVVTGQAAELRLLVAGPPAWQQYAACVEGKTSALFALPLEGAAIISGLAPAEASALARAFRPLGLLFQIQDDILDLYGDNGRDRPGSDITQTNKASALVVEYMRLVPSDVPWLMSVLHAAPEATTAEMVATVTRRFISSGALAAVWRKIDDITAGVRSAPPLVNTPALLALASEVIETALAPVEHTRSLAHDRP